MGFITYFPIAAIPIAIALLAIFTFSLAYILHFFQKPGLSKPSYGLSLDGEKTSIDSLIEKLAEDHSGLGAEHNALGLVVSNLDAFAGRIHAAGLAGRSLDLMYYIWDDDLTGRLLLYEVLKAADRGVRVRLLLDDINAYGRDPIYAALDQHANIEVRIFNPGIVRSGRLKRATELFFRAFRITRRMHNKAYIVDGRLAFVGGRNIADSYFDACQNSNFRDLDLLLIGPRVKDIENIFDRYWNSNIVQPVRFFALKQKLKDLEHWRTKLISFSNEPKAEAYRDYMYNYFVFKNLLRVNRVLFKVEKVEVFADPPEKALQRNHDEWMIRKIFARLRKAQERVQITSPYFVPGKLGVNFLNRLVKAGLDVQILTNSLAATDVALVHSGYILYRKKLLKNGVQLFELKPDGGARHRLRLLGLKRASLHTKAFLIDKKVAFVGSFNFDSRSASLNTEMGLLFECPAIAARMDLLFTEEITGEMSYRLTMDKKNKITWHWIDDARSKQDDKDPESIFWQRCFVKLISWLPIESQL